MELATAFQRSRPLLTAFELELFTALDVRGADVGRGGRARSAPTARDRPADERAGRARPAREGGRPLPEFTARRDVPREGAARLPGRPRAYQPPLGHLEPPDRRRPRGPRGGTRRDAGPARRGLAAAVHRGHARAGRQGAGQVVAMLDLDGVSRVLDVGGGSGAYAMAFVRARRGISAVVFDLPKVVPLTRMYTAQEGLAAEVSDGGGQLPGGSARRRVRPGVHVGRDPQQRPQRQSRCCSGRRRGR